jgi:lysophospholipase L1-like esterase
MASLRTVAAVAVLLLLWGGTARADGLTIVVFGDSSTFGSGPGGRGGRTGQTGGVPFSEAFAAKLQTALRANGWNVSVLDASAPGKLAVGAGALIPTQVPAGTKLTIVALGATDINYRHASKEEIAFGLNNVVNALHTRGSLVILVRRWPGDTGAALAAVTANADAYVDWWNGLIVVPGIARPEYDSGDGEHLNSTGVDILISRAVPDIEKVLSAHGIRSG